LTPRCSRRLGSAAELAHAGGGCTRAASGGASCRLKSWTYCAVFAGGAPSLQERPMRLPAPPPHLRTRSSPRCKCTRRHTLSTPTRSARIGSSTALCHRRMRGTSPESRRPSQRHARFVWLRAAPLVDHHGADACCCHGSTLAASACPASRVDRRRRRWHDHRTGLTGVQSEIGTTCRHCPLATVA